MNLRDKTIKILIWNLPRAKYSIFNGKTIGKNRLNLYKASILQNSNPTLIYSSRGYGMIVAR